MSILPFNWQLRLNAALILMLMEFASILALKMTPRDDSYYLVCGAFNLAIIIVLGKTSRAGLIRDLQIINLVALVVQFGGFLSYWYDAPIQLYNCAIHLLSLVQVLRLLLVGKDDANECRENTSWLHLFRNTYLHWSKGFAKKEKA